MNEKSLHTYLLGDLSETVVVLRCIERGWHVFKPYTSGSAIDLIIDVGERLVPIQIKTASQQAARGSSGGKNRFIPLLTGKTVAHRDRRAERYRRIEFFIAVDRRRVCYVIPADPTKRVMSLYLSPALREKWDLIGRAKPMYFHQPDSQAELPWIAGA